MPAMFTEKKTKCKMKDVKIIIIYRDPHKYNQLMSGQKKKTINMGK